MPFRKVTRSAPGDVVRHHLLLRSPRSPSPFFATALAFTPRSAARHLPTSSLSLRRPRSSRRSSAFQLYAALSVHACSFDKFDRSSKSKGTVALRIHRPLLAAQPRSAGPRPHIIQTANYAVVATMPFRAHDPARRMMCITTFEEGSRSPRGPQVTGLSRPEARSH